MKIRFFGHAAIGIEAGGGQRILFDPYEPNAFGGRLSFTPIPGRYDYVVVSHDHADHNHVVPSFGRPTVVSGPVTHGGLIFRTFTVKHGDAAGTVDFDTRITAVKVDDVTLVHPGDIGKPLTPEMAANLQGTDILFVPVGGYFTMGPAEARTFIRQLNPRLVIPMHYRHRHCNLQIGPLDDFLKVMDPVRRLETGEIDVTAGSLPARTEVWALPPLCVRPGA